MPSKTTQTAFRLNARDLAIIDDVKERAGLTTRTEALRFLLRAWEETQSESKQRNVRAWAAASKGKRK